MIEQRQWAQPNDSDLHGRLSRLKGLTTQEAVQLQEQYGKNELVPVQKRNFLYQIYQVLTQPMFLLLIMAAAVYFILGEPRDGGIMLVFVVGIISIDVIQEWKTDRTLKALQDLSAPRIKVLRDGEDKIVNSADLVPGDIMYIAEGIKIPADGMVVRASTLCVDESSLTGESLGVWKVIWDDCGNANHDYWRRDYCYAGTLVTQGTGLVLVDKIGSATEYGKIGKDISNAPTGDTPLQKQTGRLVKLSGAIAALFFILVGIVTFINIPDHQLKSRIIESILAGITLAMAMIPEEFPVILTVFLSMGAWRLAKQRALVRRLPAVEILGAVSVLCVDKIGTITQNKMAVRETYSLSRDEISISRIMGMGCEPDAYDPMEKAMLARCEELGITKQSLFGGQLLKEYAFTDETKVMGHVWRNDGHILVAAKGSPERVMALSDISWDEKTQVETKMHDMAKLGLRVIGVAQMIIRPDEEIPETLAECKLEFLGLIGLADPPRESIKDNIDTCTRAGVRVVMITGDNGITASSIAQQVNMPNNDKIITGDELNEMEAEELRVKVRDVSIFSRVLPEHKMRIVKALKENGEVVAMTGDGVNDAPALKYADIGIAMGKRGSEVAREAADLILLDDNFSTIVDTINDGRRIYDNIKKSVGYVFTIHIPIAFSALLAPLLGINPVNLLLLPLHVVLLELVIDPTCSIALERQPAEPDTMERPPRDPNEKLLDPIMLGKSILQGLTIFGASFAMYYSYLNQYPDNAALARTMGLSIILLANVLLVQVNSSNTQFVYQTFRKQIKDIVMWMVIVGTIAGLIIMIYTPLNGFLKLAPLSASQMLLAIGISCASVLWYELVKAGRTFRGQH